jgi:HlyD family secretion protein
MTKKKLIIIVGVIVVVGVIIALNVLPKKEGQEVEVAVVARGEIVSMVTASGELRAKSQIDISAEMIGRIKRVHYTEGDYVKKGALVIELDDVKADANRKLAQAQLKQAEQAYDRGMQLFQKELISQESFEKIELSYETARAQYEQAHDTYRKTRIYAPISGKIMKLNVEEGETAMMGTTNIQGTVLMTIADMSSMVAVVTIDETDVPQVRISQAVEVIADALPDSMYPGVVTKVGLMPITSQLTTEKVTDFEVEIELKEFSPLLRPGMNVKVEITTDEKTDVFVIPIQASGKRKIEEEMSETVFLVHEGKAHLTEVETGIASDIELEILTGLQEGDTIIIGPYRVLSKLKDGQPVTFTIAEDDTMETTAPETSNSGSILRSTEKRI